MATTITSPNTNDVVNWAYKYTLACSKLTAAENAASSSATRRSDIATAKADFNSTMKSLVPTTVQSSVQFQYFDALTAYNTQMGAATTEAQRQAATTSLNTALGNITMPSATSTTLSDLTTDTLKAQKTNLSNAAADIKSMASNAAMKASNAGFAWLSSVASGANSLNSKSAAFTEELKSMLAKMGQDTSQITTPTFTTKATSAFAAASAAAATNGTPGSILNAALIGYMAAEQSAPTSDSG